MVEVGPFEFIFCKLREIYFEISDLRVHFGINVSQRSTHRDDQRLSHRKRRLRKSSAVTSIHSATSQT